MKILVTVKRVEDPEIKIKVNADGSDIDTNQMKYVVNPFDEIAIEEALRVTAKEGGDVVLVCLGSSDATQQIRTGLAMGAARAVHIVNETPTDPATVALAMQKVIEEEKPDIVLLGKQAIDDDTGAMGGMLAEKLGWGLASFASKEDSLESDAEKSKTPALTIQDGAVQVVREVDGGLETVQVTLPAIITTELRLNVPRYASLPGIMKAKKKEIKQIPLADLTTAEPQIKVLKMEAPPTRKAGVMVDDIDALMDKLRNEAKVL